MKQMKLIVTFTALAALAVGCKPSEAGSTSGQINRLTQDTREAAQDMKDYTYAQKAEFVVTMQRQLEALNKDLDQLSLRIKSSSDAVKAEAGPKLQALRAQAAQLNKQLEEARNATESTWDSAKDGFVQAYEASKDGFQQARQWASDAIAP